MENDRRHISDGIYRIRKGINRIIDDDEDTYPIEGRRYHDYAYPTEGTRYRDHIVDHYGEPLNKPHDSEFVPKYKRRLDPKYMRTDDIDKQVEDHVTEVSSRAKSSLNSRKAEEKQRQIDELKHTVEQEKQNKVDRMKDELEEQKEAKEVVKHRKAVELRNLKEEID